MSEIDHEGSKKPNIKEKILLITAILGFVIAILTLVDRFYPHETINHPTEESTYLSILTLYFVDKDGISITGFQGQTTIAFGDVLLSGNEDGLGKVSFEDIPQAYHKSKFSISLTSAQWELAYPSNSYFFKKDSLAIRLLPIRNEAPFVNTSKSFRIQGKLSSENGPIGGVDVQVKCIAINLDVVLKTDDYGIFIHNLDQVNGEKLECDIRVISASGNVIKSEKRRFRNQETESFTYNKSL